MRKELIQHAVDVCRKRLTDTGHPPVGPLPVPMLENVVTLLAEENEHLSILLDPRQWTKEMHDAWHRALPDTIAAFAALREMENG